jgi:deoxyribodipyrimidine photo-lyase
MQKTEVKNHLVWFRNDLRTQDNTALVEACKNADKVLGVYCLDPKDFQITNYGFKKTGKYRVKFLLETLSDLKNEFRSFEH